MEKAEVAARIKHLREAKNLSQNALANMAGISPTYIYQLEKGEKSPTVEYLGYICAALGISLSEFFDGKTASTCPEITALAPEQLDSLNCFLKSLFG